MESSTVVAFRALVLLACLVVVPLAAIFGSQFPDVVKSVLIDRIFPDGVPGLAHEEPNRDMAPAFGGMNEATPAWQAGQPTATPSVAGNPGQPVAGAAPSWSGSAVEPAVAWNQPSGQVRPAGGEGPPAGQPGSAERLGVAVPADPRQSGLVNSWNQGTTAPGATAALGMSNPGAQVAPQPDRFTMMERRLRELGATYYLLETWGNDYRCHCKMAIANDPTHTRQFEATDVDPLRAMARVVEQVEAWRGSRLP